MAQTNGLNPVQIGVKIVQDVMICGTDGPDYEKQLATLHGVMSDFAMREIKTNNPRELAEIGKAPGNVLVEDVTSEENENTAIAEAYWAATSMFFRKVFQACAAAA